MNVGDLPVSGNFYQRGAVAQIVVQFLDYTTGLPVPLQAATALTIVLGYPDGNNQQSFAATLYTDGSDGMITYTTVNNGLNIVDLSEVGLYAVQGVAYVGGVPITSMEGDFYVLPNIIQGATPMIEFSVSALILFDVNKVRWALTVDTGGGLHWVATPTGPSSFLQLNQLVMKDENGVYWTVTIGTNGQYVSTPGGSFTNAIDSFLLTDMIGKSWVVTLSTQGVLGAA